MLQQDETYKATELKTANESSPHTAEDQHEASQRRAIPNPQLPLFLALLLNVKHNERSSTHSLLAQTQKRLSTTVFLLAALL